MSKPGKAVNDAPSCIMPKGISLAANMRQRITQAETTNRRTVNHMNLHLAEAGRTLIPRKDDEYGLLSPAMVLMTFIAGLVDALSYLALGHVFVANVTGNIVFLGFALAHAQGFVWWTSALTLVCFAFGAFIGGRIIRRFGEHRARHLLISSIVQAAFILAALIGLYLLNHLSLIHI